MTQGIDWPGLANSFKTDALFFSPTAANNLASFFDGINELKTNEGRSLVVDAGPGTDFHTLFRAQIFPSHDKLKAALGRPDIHLGSPRSRLAIDGRMSGQGILAFCATNNLKAAIAGTRPSAGSRIAVGQFEIIRKLRLLDLTVIDNVRITGSLADFGLAGRTEVAVFLRSLSARLAQSVMFDAEPSEYLAAEAMVHFLLTEASVPIDGIIFPSGHSVRDALGVLLFHGASSVEPMNFLEGTEIGVRTGRWAEAGWMEDYEVFEEMPQYHSEIDKGEQEPGRPDSGTFVVGVPVSAHNADWRDHALRIVPESVKVHHVKRIEIEADEFAVKRRRQKGRDGLSTSVTPAIQMQQAVEETGQRKQR
nr:RES domain-containing protein [Bradyrhizobium symbiodeficiens]